MKRFYKLADNLVASVFQKDSCESCCDDVANIILFDYSFDEEDNETENYSPMYCYACYYNSYEDMVNPNIDIIKEFLVEYSKKNSDAKEMVVGIEEMSSEEVLGVFENVGWLSTTDILDSEDDYYDED